MWEWPFLARIFIFRKSFFETLGHFVRERARNCARDSS